MSSGSHPKIRRAHTKSRKGCSRCKHQRKKCDELLPKCTRCEGLDIDCEYARPHFETKLTPAESLRSRGKLSNIAIRDPENETPLNQHSLSLSIPATSTKVLLSEATWLESQSSIHQHLPAIRSRGAGSVVSESSIDVLDARELELFGHYLSHTSRIIPYDESDLYALQVGLPNLAFGSKPLMRSILALAAACECHDMLGDQQHYQLNAETQITRVQELLTIAEQHHRASLQHTRETIPTATRYDCILGSAALMVLYGSAIHGLRIRLMKTYRDSTEALPSEFLPLQSQWIFLIRAVNSAYVGLVADETRIRSGGAGIEPNDAPAPPVSSPGSGSISSPEDGPKESTRRLFLPIVAETSSAAMEKLRARARLVQEATGCDTQTQACRESLVMLEMTMNRVFAERNTTLDEAETSEPALPEVIPPWLGIYIARVTSNQRCSSSPLRRTINAFLNCVPALYMDLVQSMIDHISSIGAGEPDSEAALRGDGVEITEAHLLALDIFAHWLTLVLLLDGVWWIGEIGSWELGRVVTFMRHSRNELYDTNDEDKEAWWPESMYRINIELQHHTK